MRIKTARLSANYITPADKALYCNIYSDPKLMQYVGQPLSKAAAERAWNATLKQTHCKHQVMRYWVISDSINDTKVGLGGLVWENAKSDKANIGCMFLAKAHGRGFATEFLAELGNQAFQNFGIETLYSDSMVENSISYQLMCRLGYSYKNIKLALSPTQRGYYWEMTLSDWLKNNKNSTTL